MAFRPIISKIVRRTAYGLGGTAIAGCSAITAYTLTDQGLGLRREIRFWGKVTPVVFDYWWHVSSSSPLVKFQQHFYDNNDDVDSERKETRKQAAAVEEDAELQQSSLLQADGQNISKNDNKKFLEGDKNDDDDEYESDAKKTMYKKLNARNAPKIFSIMLELGGLYIKLGQVLSVTALPVPSEYRKLFRTLQSSVPGHEEFETVIKPTLEAAFGMPLGELFESIDEIPCGAASIGQAHKAKLLTKSQAYISKSDDDSSMSTGNGLTTSENENNQGNSTDVIIKVQYPDAKWQVPADVECVGDFLKLCVFFGVVDESSAKLSYEEFSRQFISELDYLREARNLQEVYESSLDPEAPYIKHGVEIPKVFPNLCSNQVITMTYIPGPKFEEEARKQLELLGIDTSRGIQSVVQEDKAKDNNGNKNFENPNVSRESKKKSRKSSKLLSLSSKQSKNSWIVKFAEHLGAIVGVDNILFLVRLARQALLWSTAVAVQSIQLASRTTTSVIPISQEWLEWAKDHENAASQAEMLDWTSDAIDALFDVHGYQIFNQGLFNADAHPGNILVIQNSDENSNSKDIRRRRKSRPKLGLIDYGQCKRLDIEERRRVARLIISVANDESDEQIALHCRDLGFITKNDSTKFLSTFARLMFGKFRSEHLKRAWHKSLHDEDEIVYFPNELSMVYRTSLLLRGLAMSFQLNISVAEEWREHAQTVLNQQ
jgi:aarF domain-containing kinase